MRILVTFAVEAEFAPWRKLREFKKRPRMKVRLCNAFRSSRRHSGTMM